MARAKVLSRTEVPSADPARAGKADIVTIFTLVDAPGSLDRVRLPAEAWSEQAEEAAIRKAVGPRQRGIGREIDLG